ncbi:hypothetical protein DKC05_21345 [Serratia marcescens]|uniref:Uncharacterized protein n=1 Tax=Serratia marcescens TaxID=615 RepID=A0AB33FTH3_SERMA|nr:hypothetical protein DKC05_21345 [Serratia marcescens]
MFGALCRRRPPIRKEGWVERGANGEDSPRGAACALLTAYFLRRGVFHLGFAPIRRMVFCNYAHFAGAMMSSDNGALFTVSAGQRH